jgi:hypothetical protein
LESALNVVSPLERELAADAADQAVLGPDLGRVGGEFSL